MKNLLIKLLNSLLILAMFVTLSSCGDDDNPASPGKSSAKEITSFKFEAFDPDIAGTIDNVGKKVTVKVPLLTDVTNLNPTIAVSPKATITPASNVPQDFTNPVQYTVTAEDGSSAVYTVTVTEDNNGTLTPELLSGTLSENKTLKNWKEGIDYRVDGTLYINGNALLTIEPGVVVEFQHSSDYMVIEGDAGLKIDGNAANPVVFTGPSTNPNKGSWGGIEIRTNRADNVWNYVHILNAGTQDGSAVFVGGDAKLSMKNCLIQGSLGFGLHLGGGAALTEFSNNKITDCDEGPVYLYDLIQAEKFDNTSDFSGNAVKYINVDENSNISKNLTLKTINAPYSLGTVYIEESKKLSIQPGLNLDFKTDSYLQVNSGGTLSVEGTPENKVTFSGTGKFSGSWEGVFISSNAQNVLQNCVIEYAGHNYESNLDIQNARVNMTNVLIKDSDAYGIKMNDESNITHSNVTFDNCASGNVYNTSTDEVLDELP